MASAAISQAGTWSVTDIELVVAGTSSHASASEAGVVGNWSIEHQLYTPGWFNQTSLDYANPTFKWTLTWTPSYPNEPVPQYGHCKIRMDGYANIGGVLTGYPQSGTPYILSHVEGWDLFLEDQTTSYNDSLGPNGSTWARLLDCEVILVPEQR